MIAAHRNILHIAQRTKRRHARRIGKIRIIKHIKIIEKMCICNNVRNILLARLV